MMQGASLTGEDGEDMGWPTRASLLGAQVRRRQRVDARLYRRYRRRRGSGHGGRRNEFIKRKDPIQCRYHNVPLPLFLSLPLSPSSTNKVRVGDKVIGLPSSGVHSNGFSLVRRILSHVGAKLSDPLPGTSTTLGEALIKPTIIYVKQARRRGTAGGIE